MELYAVQALGHLVVGFGFADALGGLHLGYDTDPIYAAPSCHLQAGIYACLDVHFSVLEV